MLNNSLADNNRETSTAEGLGASGVNVIPAMRSNTGYKEKRGEERRRRTQWPKLSDITAATSWFLCRKNA